MFCIQDTGKNFQVSSTQDRISFCEIFYTYTYPVEEISIYPVYTNRIIYRTFQMSFRDEISKYPTVISYKG